MSVRIDRVRLLNRLGPFDFIDFQFIALGKQRGMMSPRILQHDIKPGPSLPRLPDHESGRTKTTLRGLVVGHIYARLETTRYSPYGGTP